VPKDLHAWTFIDRLKELPFVEGIWLFGSRARGDATQRSDIDLAIVCPTATQVEWAEILAIQATADTLLKLDCIRFDALKRDDPLRANILKFKKILYTREEKMRDIFWKDSFLSLGQAIQRLADVLHHPEVEKNDYMRDATIQRFEFVIELFWKILKKCLTYEKIDAVTPRDVLAQSYQFQLIDHEAVWLSMLDDHNKTSHAYKQAEAERVFKAIQTYLPVFEETYQKLKLKYAL
jgi:nucleotidyltransferase substrate binding protein (TIGR01987 family)